MVIIYLHQNWIIRFLYLLLDIFWNPSNGGINGPLVLVMMTTSTPDGVNLVNIGYVCRFYKMFVRK